MKSIWLIEFKQSEVWRASLAFVFSNEEQARQTMEKRIGQVDQVVCRIAEYRRVEC